MDYEELISFIQGHFSDGLALVIGSGLSAAEGMPGMPELAAHLLDCAHELTDADAGLWQRIKVVLDAKEGLEAALLKHAPTPTLEDWIVHKTCEFLLPKAAVLNVNYSGTRPGRARVLVI